MVKLRDAKYCNVKLFLIYLVIYGHMIEPEIWKSPALMMQYRLIYLFHMPLFSFMSGLFLDGQKACIRQINKMLPLYVLLQTAALILGNGKVKLSTPYWHLWYLLSYCVWSGFGWLWYRFCKGRGGIIVLIASILMGCGVGFISSIGREYSLSRTIVFFPYFFMGLLCDRNCPWHRLKLFGLVGLAMVIAILLNGGNSVSVTFLYQAAPFGAMKNGFELRLICYLLGSLMCLFILAFTPRKRFPFTRAGTDTMPAYLIHAPVVLYLRKQNIPWILHPLCVVLFLYVVYKILQWNSTMYGVVQTERGDYRWPHFKKSTKNLPSRFIDSYYP